MRTRALLALATASALGLLVGAPSIAAAATDDVTVEVVGGGPFLTTEAMFPGFETSSVLRVQNSTTEAGTLELRVANLESDDNGCNEPEARVDTTCGSGEGELDEQVLLTVERELDGGGYEVVVAAQVIDELTDGVLLDDELEAGAARLYRFTLALPVESGNETQTDRVDFDIEIASQAVVVGGETALRTGEPVIRPSSGPGAEVLSSGAWSDVPVRVAAGGVAGGRLPRTGSSAVEAAATGLAAVLAGSVLVGLARRRSLVRSTLG